MEPACVNADLVVELARQLHGELGHRMTEDAYLAALAFELEAQGAHVERQRPVKLRSGGELLDMGYVPDLLVDGGIVVFLCALHKLDAANEAWVLSQLDLPGPCSGVFLDFLRPQMDILAVNARGG